MSAHCGNVEVMETETRTTYATTLAAFDETQAAIAATPTAELLRTAHVLTHRIHEATEAPITIGWLRRTTATELRQQRDMVDAEILRRADR